jgi:hypothetical protein
MAPVIGDKKNCISCGGKDTAECKQLPLNVSFQKDGDTAPEPVPDVLGWVCSACVWVERVRT